VLTPLLYLSAWPTSLVWLVGAREAIHISDTQSDWKVKRDKVKPGSLHTLNDKHNKQLPSVNNYVHKTMNSFNGP